MGDYGALATGADPQSAHVKRPSYWAMRQMAGSLQGTLLSGKDDRDDLSSWMSRRADGGISLVFVNKSFETDFRTTLKVPGLKGEAVVEILTAETSGGLKTNDPTGATWPSTGPVVKTQPLADGQTLLVPKASIVTVKLR